METNRANDKITELLETAIQKSFACQLTRKPFIFVLQVIIYLQVTEITINRGIA
jgi:hypothetical protein